MVHRLAIDGTNENEQNGDVHGAGVYVYLVFNLIGGVGMLVMLLTAALSRKVHRLPTWYSFCVSWFLSALSYTLLVFSGQQFIPDPIYSLCFIQAALIHAMPPTTGAATLALLLNILLSFPEPPFTDRWKKISLLTSCLLVMAPYTIFFILFIGISLYQTYKPTSLIKMQEGTYCSSKNDIWLKVSFSIVAILSMVIIVVQTLLVVKLYRNHSTTKSKAQSWTTTIRGIVFNLIAFISLVLSIVFTIVKGGNMAFDIVLSMLPVLALVVFGTQQDMLLAWCFWKSDKRSYKSEGRVSVFFGRNNGAGVSV